MECTNTTYSMLPTFAFLVFICLKSLFICSKTYVLHVVCLSAIYVHFLSRQKTIIGFCSFAQTKLYARLKWTTETLLLLPINIFAAFIESNFFPRGKEKCSLKIDVVKAGHYMLIWNSVKIIAIC